MGSRTEDETLCTTRGTDLCMANPYKRKSGPQEISTLQNICAFAEPSFNVKDGY
jgi:hypothetical protein